MYLQSLINEADVDLARDRGIRRGSLRVCFTALDQVLGLTVFSTALAIIVTQLIII